MVRLSLVWILLELVNPAWEKQVRYLVLQRLVVKTCGAILWLQIWRPIPPSLKTFAKNIQILLLSEITFILRYFSKNGIIQKIKNGFIQKCKWRFFPHFIQCPSSWLERFCSDSDARVDKRTAFLECLWLFARVFGLRWRPYRLWWRKREKVKDLRATLWEKFHHWSVKLRTFES